MIKRLRTVALWIGLFAPPAFSQTLIFSILGDAPTDLSGNAVAMVGDVDADGAQDFAIGSVLNDVGGNAAGMVRVYSGRTHLPIHTWFGQSVNERFGRAVAGPGDINGDGHDDVLVGAPGAGYTYLFSGATGLSLYRLTGDVGTFGTSVASGGEVDGDGVPDILVGAPNATPGGALLVYSGASGSLIRSHLGMTLGFFGYSSSFIGDIDGDGRDEYAIGRPLGITGGSPEVLAYDGATGSLLWTNAGPQTTDQLGWSIVPLTDVDGDGIAEILVGAPQDPGVGCGPCNGHGYVRLLNGATGLQLWQVNGGGLYAGLGFAMTSIGDVSGDGFEDFAVSQPSTEGCSGNTLPLQVRNGLNGALLFAIPNLAPGDQFGAALASGDANNDGLRDLLVGTPCDDAAGSNTGATHVYTIVRGVLPYCTSKLNSQGCLPSIYAVGVPSLSIGTFRVKALDVINNQFGLLLWSHTPAAAPFQGGYLCVKSPFVRTPVQQSLGSPPPDDCSGTYSFHFSYPYMNSVGIQAGDQIYCQYWARDPQGVAGVGLTGGLAFEVLP